MEDFLNRFMALKSGYYTGSYNDRTYSVTIEESADKRRRKLFAEELGGNDHVSFNLYLLNGQKPLLKPCEMTEDKVIDFMLGFRPQQGANLHQMDP